MYNPYQQQYGFGSQQAQGGFAGGFNGQVQYNQPQQTGFFMGNPLTPQEQPTGQFQPGQGFYGGDRFNGQPTGFAQMSLQPQQTGYIQTQPTGFQQLGGNVPTVTENIDLKIPNMRLSFISSADQIKFEHLFRTAVPKGEQAISGDAARDILLRSGLQPVTLAEIWSLVDTDKSGSLLFPEFALALHLCNLALKGEPLPGVLPEKWNNEVRSFIDAINFSIPEDPNKILANTPFASFGSGSRGSNNDWMNNSNTNASVPTTSFGQSAGFSSGQGMVPQRTGGLPFQAQQTGAPNSLMSQRTGGGSLIPLQPQQTSGLIPAQRTGNLIPKFEQKSGDNFSQTQTFNTGGMQPQRTGLQTQTTGFQPQRSNFPAQYTSFQPQATGIQPQLTGFQSSNVPLLQQRTGLIPQGTGFQPQRTGLQPQTTGFQPQITGFQPQRTGLQPQSTGFQPQSTGFQPQSTGFQPQSTGFQPQRTGIQSQQTGLFQPQQTGLMQPQRTPTLQAQPTGRPGEWGFVSMPTGGIPGLNAMEQHFLPSSQLPSHNLQNVMGGDLKTNVTWAITKQEKLIYDGIFRAWDTTRRGYVDGETAINIFGKSGLSRPDLESIWNLADGNNSGKLNMDEFAVAMHLVYRRLNGFDIPLRLPPELVPPSTKYIQDSVDSLKTSLRKLGTSKPKHEFSGKTDASRYKNNDSQTVYVSNLRHKTKTLPQDSTKNHRSFKSVDDADLTADDLRKMIREKKILLAAADVEDEDKRISSALNDSKVRQELEDIKTEILAVQSQIDQKLGRALISVDDRKNLLDKLNHLTRDQVPGLISKIYKVNKDISSAKIALAKQQILKENPKWDPSNLEANIVGTGSNGEVTQADLHKFKSKQLLRQRMAALTGKSFDNNNDLDEKFQNTVDQSKRESENQNGIVRDIETGIKDLENGCFTSLQLSSKETIDDEKWEKGINVKAAVSQFIRELNAISKSNLTKYAPTNTKTNVSSDQVSNNSKATNTASISSSELKTATVYKTPEERAAYIKAQAEKRMNERLAKLGIRRHGRGESGSHVSSRESLPDRELKPVTSSSEGVASPKDSHAELKPIATISATQNSTNEKVQDTTNKSVKAGSNEDTLVQQATSTNHGSSKDVDSDSEDEEYKTLLRQKEEYEAKERARKLKKKKEKEERLARLKKEMEELKQRELKELSDEDDAVTDVPVYSTKLKSANSNLETFLPEKETPTNPVGASANTQPVPNDSGVIRDSGGLDVNKAIGAENSKAEDNVSLHALSQPSSLQTPPTQPHKGNPFVSMNTNPFFRGASSSAPVNPVSERNATKNKDDDDWSDEEDNSSDEEDNNRAGAAQLATLLFGGGQQPKKSTTNDSEPEEVPKTQANENTNKDERTANVTDLNSSLPLDNTYSLQSPYDSAVEDIPRPEPSLKSTEPGSSLSLPIGNESSSEKDFHAPEPHTVEDANTPVTPQIPSTMPAVPVQAAPIPPDNSSDYSEMPSDVPSATAEAPPIPSEAPPIPTGIPPIPSEAPPVPSAVPPIPSEAPPIPTEVPPLPSGTAPVPSGIPPPPPPPPAAPSLPNDSSSTPSIPPPPPPPAAPAMSNGDAPQAAASRPPDINALLGQIQTGKSLKKVDDNDKHIASGSVVGRVL